LNIKEIKYNPIGIIHSPFNEIEGVPIHPSGAKDIKGSIEIRKELEEGLRDLDGFSHIILLYHFHLSKDHSLSVVPFLDNKPRGVFATRAPKRPNSIGLSVVKLIKIEKNILYIESIDVVDGTPLLDIKPYVKEFRNLEEVRIGWLTEKDNKFKNFKADKRFK
jgi:tRNA-Thr(GGU) m(6)t(6)A37 methyltransferase TsaA